MSAKTITTKEKTKILKELREQYKDDVTRTRELLKENKKIHGEICKAIREEPKTVPEIAAIVGMPTPEVLWHIIAMKKYDIVEETGKRGEYYLYQRAEEK